MATQTSRLGRLAFSDPLARRQWSKQHALQSGKTQFWKKFQGASFDKAVYHTNQGLQTGNKGNDIVYDFDGFLAQAPKHGDEQLSGTGEDMRKFSAKFHTSSMHNTAAIPKEWDAQLIGSMELARTGNVSKKMWNEYARIMDQGKFDAASGYGEVNKPSHIIMPNGQTDVANLTVADKPSLDLLEHIIYSATTGLNINVGSERPGLRQWMDSGENGEEAMVIDLVVDYHFLHALDQDPGWRGMYQNLLTDHLSNPLLTGVVTQHKNLRIHRAPMFQGYQEIDGAMYRAGVEAAGLRRFDAEVAKWTGETGFNIKSGKMTGSAFVIGAGGLISHSTLCPVDPFTIENTNHSQRKEAAIHYYGNVVRTELFEHNGDYNMRKMAGYDLGLINVAYHL